MNKHHLALIAFMLDSQDLQQNVHGHCWGHSEVCRSPVCTGGDISHWIRDRILCPPLLNEDLFSLLTLNSIFILIAAPFSCYKCN